MTVKERQQLAEGTFYAELDLDTGLYCVFHTDYKTGFAFSSYATMEQAEQDANERNYSRV